MWQNKKISVVLPTVNEIYSIKQVVRSFESLGKIDEIIVVDNNANYNVSDILADTSVRIATEKVQGYGAAIRCGLKQVKGDYIIVCEPDGTFLAQDTDKLLSYAIDFDFVVGTRTASVLIWKGANMGFFLRWGNYLMAKLVEFLFNTSSLTDAGCTYRLIKNRTLRKIQKQFTSRGSDFGLEMILLAIKNNITFIQIPVNYRPRIGESIITGSKIKTILLGLKMFWLVVKCRLNIKESIYTSRI